MERDPASLAWRAAPALHVLAFAALALAFLLAYAGIDLIRVVATTAPATVPFMRLRIDLPDALGGAFVLFPGFLWTGREIAGPIAVVALCLAIATALVAWTLGRGEAAIGRRAVARMRALLLKEIAGARPTAREEARQAAAIAGEKLARLAAPLGGALTRPALAGGALGLALIASLGADWRLALLVVVLLGVMLKAVTRAIEARDATGAARLAAGKRLDKTFGDLVRRLPAIESHGTAEAEASRVTRDLRDLSRPLAASERRHALLVGIAAFVLAALPAAFLTVAAGFGFRGGVPSTFAALAATLLAVPAFIGLARQRRALAAARPLFEDIADSLAGLRGRNRLAAGGAKSGAAEIPDAGPLVAESVSAFDPASGVRIAGLDLSIAFPAHVAVTGDAGSGGRVFAALVAGRLRPSLGRLSYAGRDLFAADPAARAKHIAFAGGEPVLVAASLRDNLLYGCGQPERAAAEQRLADAMRVTYLDRAIHARGLLGIVDIGREEKLAAALVETRRAIRAALASQDLADSVEPFDKARYNRHATIGENILFGMPLNDTFRPQNLPGHPFIQAILEAEDLTRPLVAMGHAIASSMIEIFADLPDGHPLFQRYAFFPGSERGAYEDLVERQGERRRGLEPGRDRERLIALALLYVEPRHRLGLLDGTLEQRIVKARAAFAELMPKNLRPAIEFYDPDLLCAAASLQDNLLFGRVTEERAGAEAAVLRVMRRLLKERGLDEDVVRVGLASPVDPASDDFDPGERAAIDLVRCLVRQPDILVVERGLEHLTIDETEAFVPRLRRSLAGRGLVLVTPRLTAALDSPPFDAVIRFERGAASLERRTGRAEPGAAGAVGEQMVGGLAASAGPETPAVAGSAGGNRDATGE